MEMGTSQWRADVQLISHPILALLCPRQKDFAGWWQLHYLLYFPRRKSSVIYAKYFLILLVSDWEFWESSPNGKHRWERNKQIFFWLCSRLLCYIENLFVTHIWGLQNHTYPSTPNFPGSSELLINICGTLHGSLLGCKICKASGESSTVFLDWQLPHSFNVFFCKFRCNVMICQIFCIQVLNYCVKLILITVCHQML